MIHSRRAASLLSASSAAVLLLASANSALAQVTTDDEDEARPETTDVIVVTVERREQSLQDVAGTATSFAGEELKQLGIQNFADLNGRYPGLQVANNAGNIEVYIRGVGSSNNTELGEPAAATHLDGIYIPRPSGFGAAFFDIQRVEVNVGPQGTLRGRNATAGSVNVLPWRPGIGVFDAALETSVGNYNEFSVEGMVNIPVTQNSALRLAGMYLEHDSYFNNVNPTGAELGVGLGIAESEGVGVAEAVENFGLRASYLIEPTNRLRLTFTADWLGEGGSGYTGVNYANPLGNGVRPEDIPNPRDVVGRARTPELDTDHYGFKAHVEYETDWFNIEYIGGYRDLVYDYRADTPIGPFYEGIYDNLRNPVDGNLNEAFDNFSFFQSVTDSESQVHEIRLFDELDNGAVWNAGVFYFEEDQRTFLGSTGDRGLFFSGQEFNQRTQTESIAFYADATYPVADNFRVTAGVRYSEEDKSRQGVNARYGFALGGAGYDCCGGLRIGTEGFEFNVFDRTIFNPDINGDGQVNEQETLEFFFNGVRQFGARDNVEDIFIDPVTGQIRPLFGVDLGNPAQIATYPTCVDTVVGDFWNCPSATDGIPWDNAAAGIFTFALPFLGQIAPQNGFASYDFVDWRLRFEWDISDTNLLYGSVSTGHNGGGFNDNLPDVGGVSFNPAGGGAVPFDTTTLAPTFDEESVVVYEIGSKNEFETEWGNAYFNASAFYYDYSDLIQNVLISVGQILNDGGLDTSGADPNELGLVVNFNFNAADAEIYGAQFEAGFDLPYDMQWKGTLLWMPEARIQNSELIQDSRFQADVAPLQAIPQSIDGFRLRRTPEISIQTSLSQRIDAEIGEFDWIVSYGYRSEQNQDLFNGVVYPEFDSVNDNALRLNDTVEGYSTWDLGAGFTPSRYPNLDFEVYVQNATDEQREAAIIITQFDNTRFFTRPRTYGARVRWVY
jgi:iron complex outermembrane receptor protein